MNRQSFAPNLTIKNRTSQQGFTLVELIVALALGLIITAAATQLFLGSLVSTRIQQANSELQDSGVFGLDYVARDIRLANYGNISNPELTNSTPSGGIVLSAQNVDVDDTGLTKKIDDSSDQLTIQFTAPNDMFNCEGKEVSAGEYVIQRYFLRADGNSGDKALACDANRAGALSAADIAQFGGNNIGEVIMPRVEYFRVLLGTMTTDTSGNVTTRVYNVDAYNTAANTARAAGNPVPRITSVKLGVVVRSNDTTNNKMVDTTKALKVFGANVTPANSTKYLRRAYVTTVAIRNGLGEAL